MFFHGSSTWFRSPSAAAREGSRDQERARAGRIAGAWGVVDRLIFGPDLRHLALIVESPLILSTPADGGREDDAAVEPTKYEVAGHEAA